MISFCGIAKIGLMLFILEEFSGLQKKEVWDAVIDCGGFVGCSPEATYGRSRWLMWALISNSRRKIQVIDVGINKLLKDRICDQYHQWYFYNECQS
jgi:hypothetical protein